MLDFWVGISSVWFWIKLRSSDEGFRCRGIKSCLGCFSLFASVCDQFMKRSYYEKTISARILSAKKSKVAAKPMVKVHKMLLLIPGYFILFISCFSSGEQQEIKRNCMNLTDERAISCFQVEKLFSKLAFMLSMGKSKNIISLLQLFENQLLSCSWSIRVVYLCSHLSMRGVVKLSSRGASTTNTGGPGGRFCCSLLMLS